MPEARDLSPGRVNLLDDLARLATGRTRLLEQPRARLGRAEDDRAGAEDPRRDGTLQRSGIGGERHPRRDVGRHQPVLGDADQEQVEEEALLLGRLVAGEQQVEVLGEAQPAHQVAAEVASPHLDPVRIGLADVRDEGGRVRHRQAQRYIARTVKVDRPRRSAADQVRDRERLAPRRARPERRQRHVRRMLRIVQHLHDPAQGAHELQAGGTACGKSFGPTAIRSEWPALITALVGKISTGSSIGTPGVTPASTSFVNGCHGCSSWPFT